MSADEAGKADDVDGVAAVDELRARHDALGEAAAEHEGVGALGRHAPEGDAAECGMIAQQVPFERFERYCRFAVGCE